MIPGNASKKTVRALAIAAACGIGANIFTTSVAWADETGRASWIDQATSSKAAPRAVFAGDDIQGKRNLWLTDGTSAGTSELKVAGVGSSGLSPFFLTVLGSKILFNGTDSGLAPNLWVTDGTAAGTRELNPVEAYGLGLNPGGFTVLGTKALFAGYDAGGHRNLWVTNGTSAGTSELNVAGRSPNGLFSVPGCRDCPSALAPDFTILGGKVLFEGRDTRGRVNLWVSDGTSAGTTEIAPPGANYQGLFGSNDPEFAVVGDKVVFQAEDRAYYYNLWVTDGTSAGTSELPVIGAAYDGLFSPLQFDPGLTIFGGRAVFEGSDSRFQLNLWITDGTTAGTRELVVSGANLGGLFNRNAPVGADFTVFGGKALFVGEDSRGNTGLWLTDGTSAGTIELAVTGLIFDNDPYFTVLDHKVLFAGNGTLWVTDGTVAGTSKLKVAGAYSRGLFYNPFLYGPGFAPLGKKALFAGDDAARHLNPWLTDNTSAGTIEVKAVGANPQGLLEDLLPPYFTPLPVLSPGTVGPRATTSPM